MAKQSVFQWTGSFVRGYANKIDEGGKNVVSVHKFAIIVHSTNQPLLILESVSKLKVKFS
jgi:hypothetical protein